MDREKRTRSLLALYQQCGHNIYEFVRTIVDGEEVMHEHMDRLNEIILDGIAHERSERRRAREVQS